MKNSFLHQPRKYIFRVLLISRWLVGFLTIALIFTNSSCKKDAIAEPSVSSFIKWGKCYGGRDDDRPMSLKSTPDGGYVMIGDANSKDGDLSGFSQLDSLGNFLSTFIVKVNSTGQIEWKVLLPYGTAAYNMDIEITSDGGFLFCGWCNSNTFNNLPNYHGGDDAVIVKLNSQGEIEWSKCFGGSANDYIYRIRRTMDGNYLLIGSSYSSNGDLTFNYGSSDIWVSKIDINGNLIWTKNFGSSTSDGGVDIVETSIGVYYLLGYTSGSLGGNHGMYDAFVMQLTASGNYNWYKCFGGSGNDFGEFLTKSVDGGIIIGGESNSIDGDVTTNQGGFDSWAFKISTSGNLIWQKSVGGSGNEYFKDMATAINSDIVFIGVTNSNDGDIVGLHGGGGQDGYFCKLDNNGNFKSVRTVGGGDTDAIACNIIQSSDGDFISLFGAWSDDGDVTGHNSFDNSDYWLIKTATP